MLGWLLDRFRPRMAATHAPDWPAYAGTEWARRVLNANLTDRLHVKQGRSIVRWTLHGAQGSLAVFVKRHYRHSFWRTLLSRFLPAGSVSDAGREWHHLKRAQVLGIRVPRPIAFAEWARRGTLQSTLVLEELQDMLALHEAIPKAARAIPPADFRRWKSGLVAELVRLTRLLHDCGHFHRDLYLCHFFVQSADITQAPSDWTGRVVLIDFHRLTRRRLLAPLGRVKDLAQLHYSARIPGITTRDVLRFWRLYRGGVRRRLLRRMIIHKSRQYEAHNRKHRAP